MRTRNGMPTPAAIRRSEKELVDRYLKNNAPRPNATEETKTLRELVTVKIYPMNEQSNPYVITFEHMAPSFVSSKLQERIAQLLREEFIAEGAERIKIIR